MLPACAVQCTKYMYMFMPLVAAGCLHNQPSTPGMPVSTANVRIYPAGTPVLLCPVLTMPVSWRPAWWTLSEMTGAACGSRRQACAGSSTVIPPWQVRWGFVGPVSLCAGLPCNQVSPTCRARPGRKDSILLLCVMTAPLQKSVQRKLFHQEVAMFTNASR